MTHDGLYHGDAGLEKPGRANGNVAVARLPHRRAGPLHRAIQDSAVLGRRFALAGARSQSEFERPLSKVRPLDQIRLFSGSSGRERRRDGTALVT